MSYRPMSSQREEHLTKCAEQVIELMNVGVEPNAALKKIAVDEELTDKEVSLVSHSVNNAKTVAWLQAVKPEDKDKPFPLTNAELVNKDLYEAYPVLPSERDKDKKDRDEGADDDMAAKKVAALKTHIETRNFMDIPDVFSTTYEKDTYAPGVEKVAVELTEDGSYSVKTSVDRFGRTGEGPVTEVDIVPKLARLKDVAEEARVRSTQAQELVMKTAEEVVTELSRSGASTFGFIQKSASHVSSEVFDLVWGLTNFESIGQTRTVGQRKVAGLTRADVAIVGKLMVIDEQVKVAGEYSAIHEHMSDEYDTLTKAVKLARFAKQAGEVKGSLGKGHIASFAAEAANLPADMLGSDYDRESAVNMLGSVGGSTGDAPEYEQGVLNSQDRQNIQNLNSRKEVEELMNDEYASKHPVQDVLAAYNRARAANPRLGRPQMVSIVRHDLASGGQVPLDTLLRASKATQPGEMT